MREFWKRHGVTVLLLCLPTAHAYAQSTPPSTIAATLPDSSLLAYTTRPLLAHPQITQHGHLTTATIRIPPGADYALIPTFSGLKLEISGVQVADQTLRYGGNPALTQLDVRSTMEGAHLLLLTAYPLSLQDGWRGEEIQLASGERLLTLEFAVSIIGGADTRIASSVRPQVISEAEVPPGDSAGPVSVPVPAPLKETPGHVTNAAEGRIAGPAAANATLSVPRIGKHPGMTRVVLDLPSGATYRIQPHGSLLRIELTGVTAQPAAATGASDELLAWRVEPQARGVTVTLGAARPLSARSGWRSMLLPPADGQGEHRLAIDLSPAFADLAPLTSAERRVPPLPTSRPATLPLGTAAATFLTSIPLEKPTVVLDAGHGGKYPGAVGAVVEKDVTLDVALRVRSFLTEAGVNVVMTRDSDRHLSSDLASDLAARAAMAAAPAKLFVSIHVNSTVPERANHGYGVETWWNNNHPGSKALADALQRQLSQSTAAFPRGLKSNQSLAVLRHARVPAALVEMGFASHPVDGLNLTNSNYLDRVALGIALGIRDSLLNSR